MSEVQPQQLRGLVDDDAALHVMHQAIEGALVEFRDLRLSALGARNGLVIRERDGADSGIIRLTIHDALKIGLGALAAHLTGAP